MSSKKQTRGFHDHKTERKFRLSRHYHEIGIKAAAAATRKESASPRSCGSMAINHKGTVRKEDMMSEMSRTARETFDKTLGAGSETVRGVQEGVTSALESVRDLNVRLIDIAQANTDAAFDFAREVAEAKAPSDLAQAWTTHATKQFDMLTEQASQLTTFSQQVASASTAPIKRRVVPASKRQ